MAHGFGEVRDVADAVEWRATMRLADQSDRAEPDGGEAELEASGVQVTTIPDSGHNIMLDDPDAFVRAVGDCLGALAPVAELRVALTVDDLDAAMTFYLDALGLPVLEAFTTGDASGAVLATGRGRSS